MMMTVIFQLTTQISKKYRFDLRYRRFRFFLRFLFFRLFDDFSVEGGGDAVTFGSSLQLDG